MVRILDPANFPEKGFKPNKVKMILFCLGPGAGFGVLFVFLIDFLDMSFRKPEEIEEELGLNVLATIPEIDSQKSKPKRTIFDKIEERIGG